MSENSPRFIKDVARIDAPRARPITSVEDIPNIVEAPLVPVVEELFKKNIFAFETSANLQRGDAAWVDIYSDALSDENNDILFELRYKAGLSREYEIPGVVVDEKELMEEGGRYYWSFYTEMKPDEPIEAIAQRIKQVTDQLKPQEAKK